MMKDRIDEEVGYYNGPSAKHIMFTIGSDFQYQNAAQNFLNWDKMILHFNKQHGDSMKLMYSTPSCFINAIHQEQSDYPWPVKQDDFFPYADPDEHRYFVATLVFKRRSIDLSGAQEKEDHFHYKNFLRASK